MGVKTLIILLIAMVLVSACSIKEKTKPIVTDITGEVVKEVKEEESKVEEEVNKTIPEEVEEIEINESEEEGQVKEELPPKKHITTIRNLKLEPQELTIKKGDTVIWKHEDVWEGDNETKHYLVAHSNEFRSPVLYYGKEFEHTFNKTGVFTYIDLIYKDREYLRGKIVVE